ncbi:MAG: hypothetical protein RL514_1005 [Verrucomicrobiota bacterium]|jgi:hypothetical protein
MALPFEPTTLDAEHGWDPLNDEPVVALNNRLAAVAELTEVTRADLTALEAQYQVSFARDYADRLGQFYTDYLAASLADKKFTREEVAGLWHLKWLFDISDEQHTALYRRVATDVYLRTVDEVMSDFAISPEEKRFLAQLGEYLDLPADLRSLAFDTRAQMMLHDAFDMARSDGQLTDQELEQLRVLQKQLGSSLALTAEDRACYQRARLVWVIKHAPKLEPLTSIPLKLPATEECYFRHSATFIALPPRREKGLSAADLRAKLAADAFWFPEVGEMPVQPKVLDTGEVFVTNRHLWLDGRVQKSQLGLHLIEDFDACPAWVDIRCDHGKVLRLMMTKNVDVLAQYLARLLRDL